MATRPSEIAKPEGRDRIPLQIKNKVRQRQMADLELRGHFWPPPQNSSKSSSIRKCSCSWHGSGVVRLAIAGGVFDCNPP